MFSENLIMEYKIFKILGIPSGKTLEDYTIEEVSIVNILAEEISKYQDELFQKERSKTRRPQ